MPLSCDHANEPSVVRSGKYSRRAQLWSLSVWMFLIGLGSGVGSATRLGHALLLLAVARVRSISVVNAGAAMFRYCCGLTVQEFEVSVVMRHLLYDRMFTKSSLVMLGASMLGVSSSVIVAYLTLNQMWTALIVMNVFGAELLSKITDVFTVGIHSKMRAHFVGKAMRTYGTLSHSRERVSLEEYVNVLQTCMMPILQFPSKVLGMLTECFTCLWTVCYMLYLVNPNVYHVIYLAAGGCLFRYILKRQYQIDKQWDEYVTDVDRYISIRCCLDKMVQNLETSYNTRRKWGVAQNRHWTSIRDSELITQTYLSCSVVALVVGVYWCSKGIGHFRSIDAPPAGSDQLTLAFMCAVLPRVGTTIGFCIKMASPQSFNANQSTVFPRIHSMVKKLGWKQMSTTPIKYPLVVKFPYIVKDASIVVHVKDVSCRPNSGNSMARLVVQKGDRVLVWGESGSGKSSVLLDIFKLSKMPDNCVTNDGYFQWIGEGVAAGLDFKYLTFDFLFNMECPSDIMRRGYDQNQLFRTRGKLTSKQIELIDIFHLRDMYVRCTRDDDDDGGRSPPRHLDRCFLVDASAGEKNRLHSMACIWKAMQDPKISTVVWDEGEQGISPSMFISILEGVERKLVGKTFICISHCADARLCAMWDTIMALKNQ